MNKTSENLICPFCSDDSLDKTGPEPSSVAPQSHRGTLTKLYECSECGFEAKKVGTGCLRATSSEPITWTQYETVPANHMSIVNGDSGKVENSVEQTKNELHRAIEYCQKQDSDWYIVPSETTYKIEDNHVQEDIEEIADARITPEGDFFSLN